MQQGVEQALGKGYQQAIFSGIERYSCISHAAQGPAGHGGRD